MNDRPYIVRLRGTLSPEEEAFLAQFPLLLYLAEEAAADRKGFEAVDWLIANSLQDHLTTGPVSDGMETILMFDNPTTALMLKLAIQ